MLILKGAAGDGAAASLARIREAVLAYPWTTLTPGIALATSIGVASFHMHETAEQTFRRADKALYWAKQSGRNRIRTVQNGHRMPIPSGQAIRQSSAKATIANRMGTSARPIRLPAEIENKG